MRISARFVGKNSLGYEHGKRYELIVIIHSRWEAFFTGCQLSILRYDPEDRAFPACPYKNVVTFLKNWDFIKHI
jgi:hypothetical protein